MRFLSHLGWRLLVPAVALSAACAGIGDDSRTTGEPKSIAAPLGGVPEAAFTAFESGQVRPLALSPNGKLLFAVNTPDNRLEIFRVKDHGLQAVASVPVGLEPVAVAARSEDEVWVVNHLSDSISIVHLDDHPHVVRTLLVGDEPRDIVFAGADKNRAFITTAHRGQNIGFDPQLTTAGIGRADVWVFDADALGDALGGTPTTIINLFSDTPRALAVTPDGSTVYAAGFDSGNRTTVLHERIVTNGPNGDGVGGFAPPPLKNAAGIQRPLSGLIVRNDGTHWVDELGRVWDNQVKFNLPDKDVFAIDATANPPAPKSATSFYSGVGTTLFNMAVNPVSGKVYVSNTDARNNVRFEGHNAAGLSTHGTVRGHIVESRITVLDGGVATAHHLNSQLDYTRDATDAEHAASLAFPTGMEVTADGGTLYVAALGSSKVGVFSTSELEAGTFTPSTANQIAVKGGGPTGMALDEKEGVLFVLTRFDNSISVIDTGSKSEVAHVSMFNPEPASITSGRRFLYDAAATSNHGDSACASCHVFGDFDSLAWDLGDPDGAAVPIPGPFTIPTPVMNAIGLTKDKLFNVSLKGPMTTQSLRGMANHGPMHWRGDRGGGLDPSTGAVVPSAQPNTGTFDEVAAFAVFNVAFPGLLGANTRLSPADMQAFTDFILQVTYPPNPVRHLDNSLTPAQQAGRDFYFNHVTDAAGVDHELPSDTFRNCNGCHTLDPDGNKAFGVAKPGFFGTEGRYSFEDEPQFMKVPHLRNAYQKVGMFGMANTFGLKIDSPAPNPPLLAFLPEPLNNNHPAGDQVRGFGFIHDGSSDTLFRFFGSTVFAQRPTSSPFPNPYGIPPTADGVRIRLELEQFVLAFDSNLKPIVGQQTTLTETNGAVAGPRIDLLEARALAGDCDLVVKTADGHGYLYAPVTGTYTPDESDGTAVRSADLRAAGDHGPLTFTAVPPGSGVRIGIDRDLDGVLDGDDDGGDHGGDHGHGDHGH
ncbi:MAG: hypothetical protein NVS3B10_03320 [Polyangiales bacterium]